MGTCRPPKTWPRPSGSGSSRSFRTGCCGRSGSGRPTRTGPRSVTKPETRDRARPQPAGAPVRVSTELSGAPAGAPRELRKRYTAADLAVFTRAEASRFVPHGDGDPQNDMVLAWELLYRLEPGLYDRLASAERLHPGVVGWLPRHAGQIAEVGAGTGRLTMELIGCGERIVAVEPALPLRRPGGCVAIIWPNHLDWLAARGYRYVSFPGPMSVEFGSFPEAVELAGIFYPQAAGEVRRRGSRRVPFEVLGII